MVTISYLWFLFLLVWCAVGIVLFIFHLVLDYGIACQLKEIAELRRKIESMK